MKPYIRLHKILPSICCRLVPGTPEILFALGDILAYWFQEWLYVHTSWEFRQCWRCMWGWNKEFLVLFLTFLPLGLGLLTLGAWRSQRKFKWAWVLWRAICEGLGWCFRRERAHGWRGRRGWNRGRWVGGKMTGSDHRAWTSWVHWNWVLFSGFLWSRRWPWGSWNNSWRIFRVGTDPIP